MLKKKKNGFNTCMPVEELDEAWVLLNNYNHSQEHLAAPFSRVLVTKLSDTNQDDDSGESQSSKKRAKPQGWGGGGGGGAVSHQFGQSGDFAFGNERNHKKG